MPRRSKKSKKSNSQSITKLGRQMGIPNGFPNTRLAKLIYNDNISLTSTAGVMASHLFRCNSIFDPDYTGVGHQPFLSDTWAGMYNHVTVKGARLTVRWNNGLSDVVKAPTYVGTYVADGTSPPYSVASTYIEAQRGQTRIFQDDQAPPVTHCNFSLKKFFNIDNVKDNYDRFGHSTTSSTAPEDVAYFILWAQAIGGNTSTVTADVTISYVVEYSEPRDIAAS